MLNSKFAHRAAKWCLLAALAIPISGCMAYNNTSSDFDRTPIVNAGTGATIIYPGQGAPAMPGSVPGYPSSPPQSPSPSGQPVAPESQAPYPGTPQAHPPYPPAPQPQAAHPPQTPYPSGVPAPSGSAPPPQAPAPEGGIAFLGGSRMEENRHVDIRKDPLVIKYLTAPFKLAAAPFVLVKEAIEGDPEPGPAIPSRPDPQLPHSGAAPAPQRPPATDYETAMLNELERQLDERNASHASQAPQYHATPAQAPQSYTAPARTQALSIADELRELQRTPEAPRARLEQPSAAVVPRTTPSASRPATGSAFATASGIVDRNNDGRVDQWIFRESGEIEKEVLDEDFDGRPDRTIVYDAQTHQPRRVEEDTNGDGVLDSWTDYRDGEIVRRRSDANGDGSTDTWSFFRAGELTRHEQDTSGNGFRDVVSFFENGRRVREERDANGDGQADVILYYDSNEELRRREEDRDGDGGLEVVSHYEDGRLVRRELLDVPAVAGRMSEGEEATR